MLSSMSPARLRHLSYPAFIAALAAAIGAVSLLAAPSSPEPGGRSASGQAPTELIAAGR